MNGAVIYRGPSALGDGATVFVVATGLKRPTSNGKTGDMIQTWILRQDANPVRARRAGLDAAICGTCPFRDGGCYVNWQQGPRSVWQTYRRQTALPDVVSIERIGEGRKVRVGAAGDPAAVPSWVWDALLRRSTGWTGYSHQWAGEPIYGLSRILMASTESEEGTRQAWAEGWRTFRVRATGAPLMSGEIDCPAALRPGKVTCASCGLCRGAAVDAPSISIEAHGGAAQKRKAEALAGAGS